MYSKSAIALVAVLGAFAFAVPTVSHAADQSEWLQRQLQMTDGYAPPPVLLAQGGDRAAASAIRGGALRNFTPEGSVRPTPTGDSDSLLPLMRPLRVKKPVQVASLPRPRGKRGMRSDRVHTGSRYARSGGLCSWRASPCPSGMREMQRDRADAGGRYARRRHRARCGRFAARRRRVQSHDGCGRDPAGLRRRGGRALLFRMRRRA